MLTALVVVHELGHYLAARWRKIPIKEFAVGFGPKILTTVRNGIRYSLRALPLGGFVSFYNEYGEDERTSDKDEKSLKKPTKIEDERIPEYPDPRSFNLYPKSSRAITLASGVIFNLIFAVIVTAVVLTTFGDFVPVVQSVEPGMGAEISGILPGDRIVEINGQRIDFVMEFAPKLGNAKNVEVGVVRNGAEHKFNVSLTQTQNGARMGISYARQRHIFGFFEGILLSFKWLWLIMAEMFGFLGGLFRGVGTSDVTGPIGTITIMGQAARGGIEIILRIIALVSINLGVINALPFPGLDGGRLVLLGVEAVRKKPLPVEKEGIINVIGLVILFGLIIVLTFQDITRLTS